MSDLVKYVGFLVVYDRNIVQSLELFCVGTIKEIVQKCLGVLGTGFYIDDGNGQCVLKVMAENKSDIRAYLVPLSLDGGLFKKWCSQLKSPKFMLDWRYSSYGATMTPQGYAELICYAKWLNLMQPQLEIAEISMESVSK